MASAPPCRWRRPQRLCPHLIAVSQRHGVYGEYSQAVLAILRDMAPYVEPLSIDEAFLDVTILPKPIAAIAHSIQRRVNTELDLPCSVGGATNKLLAKTANTIGKARQPPAQPPNAITIVPPGAEAAFLAPLPIRQLWGIGPKHAQKLQALGLSRIGDVLNWSEAALTARLGKLGGDIWQRAQGLDFRPVLSEHEVKSISKELTFATDVADATELKMTLRRFSDGVGRQARKAGLAGATIKIKLRWPNFNTVSRQLTLEQPTALDSQIFSCARQLFEQVWLENKPVRLLGVGLSGFGQPQRQLALWQAGRPQRQEESLQAALDGLRDKFGEQAIRRASDLRYTSVKSW